MADRVKSSKQLKLVMGFADGDDRTLALDDPADNLTAATINSKATAFAAAVEGDKTAAAFTKFKSAKIVEQTTTYLDLTTA